MNSCWPTTTLLLVDPTDWAAVDADIKWVEISRIVPCVCHLLLFDFSLSTFPNCSPDFISNFCICLLCLFCSCFVFLFFWIRSLFLEFWFAHMIWCFVKNFHFSFKWCSCQKLFFFLVVWLLFVVFFFYWMIAAFWSSELRLGIWFFWLWCFSNFYLPIWFPVCVLLRLSWCWWMSEDMENCCMCLNWINLIKIRIHCLPFFAWRALVCSARMQPGRQAGGLFVPSRTKTSQASVFRQGSSEFCGLAPSSF